VYSFEVGLILDYLMALSIIQNQDEVRAGDWKLKMVCQFCVNLNVSAGILSPPPLMMKQRLVERKKSNRNHRGNLTDN